MAKCYLAVTLVAAMIYSASAGEAQLVCEAPTFDFGIVTSTQIVRHVFVMRNTGAATATISRVHSTCGCTTTQPTRKVVPPGESEPLVVHFNAKGKMGSQNRKIYVNYNSTNELPLTLSVTGMVVVAIKADPAFARFGMVSTTGAVEQVVRIYDPLSNCTFRITGVTIPHTAFSNRIDTVVEGHDYRLTIRSNGPRKAGLRVTTSATVTTDNPGHVTINVPIFLRVEGGATGNADSAEETHTEGPRSGRPFRMFAPR